MEIISSSDHNSVNGYDRLLQSQSHHYQRLNDLPADEVLIYIDKMLMEEDIQDDSMHALQESSDFQDKERSFYEVIGQKYPPSPAHEQESTTDHRFFYAAESHEVVPLNVATEFLPSNTDTKGDEVMTRRKENVNHRSSNIAEEFDMWTRADGGCDQELEAHLTDLRNAAAIESSNVQQTAFGPQKKWTGIKEAADLRSLLIMCAQSVALDDHPAAYELLRQIRPYSSLNGNVNQKLAHYFVIGLEARLAGTGSRMQDTFIMDRLSASDYFTAYYTSFISTSFRKISIFASNKLIAVKSKKSERVHIIDFGILYGLQWPAFIQRLAERKGAPPQLRITGIDFPQPNCDPSERITATASRLAHYAKLFGVPFEYNAIVQSWESIRVDDLKIEDGEFVAVNCLLRAENLQDEMIGLESPRSKVVDLIRKMNPNIFVHAVLSAGYGVPYFVTRFREALFHFSALFDMLDIVIAKDRPERMLVQGMLGGALVNVIACEGPERVSRPETHKQWQLRHTRAGFQQISFGRKLVGAIQNKVRNSYHKEFVTSEDHKWLLMSWKGRTICAISCWQSVLKSGLMVDVA